MKITIDVVPFLIGWIGVFVVVFLLLLVWESRWFYRLHTTLRCKLFGHDWAEGTAWYPLPNGQKLPVQLRHCQRCSAHIESWEMRVSP